MNQFILSRNPKQSAAWLCNSHAVKQPLEQAQMLSSCHRLLEIHKTEREILPYLRHVPEALPDLPWEDPPQCFGDHQECRGDDVVEAYRKYYKARRNEIKMEWTNREKPQWL